MKNSDFYMHTDSTLHKNSYFHNLSRRHIQSEVGLMKLHNHSHSICGLFAQIHGRYCY